MTPRSILVVRRDNIGDLVCTTPAIAALRQAFPDARLAALVNSYNADVLADNPHLDAVYAYTKLKHREAGQSALGAVWARAKLLHTIRRERFDVAILGKSSWDKHGLRLARQCGVARTIGFASPDSRARQPDVALPPPDPLIHEVEAIAQLLAPFSIPASQPELVVSVCAKSREAVAHELRRQCWLRARPTLAVHISARLPSQRWPAQRFIDTLRTLGDAGDLQFMLFWSPGDENNPMHPGDDGKANEIIAALGADFPILPWPSTRLQALIAGLSVCDGMLCSDGGAMHLGASLGLPIAALFGKSDATRWHPWGVAHEILQPTSLEVADVTAPEALAALARLRPAIDARARTRGVLK